MEYSMKTLMMVMVAVLWGGSYRSGFCRRDGENDE